MKLLASHKLELEGQPVLECHGVIRAVPFIERLVQFRLGAFCHMQSFL